MTSLYRRTLFWAPRMLSIAYIVFLSIFALDVFGEEHGFWRILLAFAMHLIPSMVLLAALLLAWRWEWVGAVLYAGAGMLYVIWVEHRPISAGLRMSWILAIAGPAFAIAALFLANWSKHKELHTRHA